MRLKEFLKEAKGEFNLASTLKNKVFEYLQHDSMLGPRHANTKWIKGFKEYKKTYTGEFPALSYGYASSRTKKEFMEDYIEHLQKSYEINGDTIVPGKKWSSWNWISIDQIDTLGEPPFKIGEGFEKVLIKSSKLKEFPAWMPKKVDELRVELRKLNSLKKVNEIINECTSMTIYCNSMEDIGVLSLFEIKGLKHLDFGSSSIFHMDLTEAVRNILKDTKSGKIDIFEIQEKLIEAGFKKNARY